MTSAPCVASAADVGGEHLRGRPPRSRTGSWRPGRGRARSAPSPAPRPREARRNVVQHADRRGVAAGVGRAGQVVGSHVVRGVGPGRDVRVERVGEDADRDAGAVDTGVRPFLHRVHDLIALGDRVRRTPRWPCGASDLADELHAADPRDRHQRRRRDRRRDRPQRRCPASDHRSGGAQPSDDAVVQARDADVDDQPVGAGLALQASGPGNGRAGDPGLRRTAMRRGRGERGQPGRQVRDRRASRELVRSEGSGRPGPATRSPGRCVRCHQTQQQHRRAEDT